MYFCIVDTETTGLDPEYHEVIEIAAIICDDNLDTIAKTSFRVHPENLERASKNALEINKYNPRTWNPDFMDHEKAYRYLNVFISTHIGDSDFILFGQNIPFDKKFLVEGYKRAGVPCLIDVPTADLMEVAKVWSKIRNKRLVRYSLGYLADFVGVVNENPHAAEADAITTLEILKWFVNDLKKDSKHVKRIVNRKSKVKIR